MLTFSGFTGINNTMPEARMGSSDLVIAKNVDAGLTGEITRRDGYTKIADTCHKNLWQAAGFMLATCGAALTAIHEDGSRHIIHPSFGHSRVWYCNLPDGRTTYTNGLLHGVTDGMTGSDRTVSTPESLGSVDSVDDQHGSLFPGEYRYYLTYVRDDGLEGAPIMSRPVNIALGSIDFSGLPAKAGYSINIYLSSLNGTEAYLAGNTVGRSFRVVGTNAMLTQMCRTLGAQPFPVGTITAFWRGRVLVAQGANLWASRPMTPHLCDWRDYKPFEANITAVQPVSGGIFVGTTEDLFFLAGSNWDSLQLMSTRLGAVTLGSGASAPGHRLSTEGTPGEAMVCIAGGRIVAGFGDGRTTVLTANRYSADFGEVWAAFREQRGVPQYMAVPV